MIDAASQTLPQASPASPANGDKQHLKILDGWRALSILLVLAGHWLPLGPSRFGVNGAVAAGGMAIFFTLSGFLITRFLLDRPSPGPFLIRRLLRILPLAWVAMIVLAVANRSADPALLLANLGFYSNLPPARFFPGGEHLWSLCVEMQFYLGVALIAAALGRRGLLLLPVIALGVTAARIYAAEPISIVTWHRVDEILAGATVALIYEGRLGAFATRALQRCNFALAAVLAIACTYALATPLAFARPYAIALMIGVSLWHVPAWFRALLESRGAAYIAKISFALYVIHGMLTHTWLGTGDTLARYAKRPLLAAATWALAHWSTFHFEQRFIDLGRRLTSRRETPALTAI